ncbi:MAG: YegP family protein [Labilithrix sp.]|nr:YegP family protein [Labilithrix sp.]MCW5818256.1 YegP family protein [Labilithrix sp.]
MTDVADQELVGRSAKFEVFQGKDGDYYFRLIAGNGEIILRSEGYTTRQSAEKGIASVIENAPDARNIEQREAKDGSFYFVVKAGNGEVIGVSEMYVSRSNAVRGARAVSALTRIIRNDGQ